jgi:hypothetical protein
MALSFHLSYLTRYALLLSGYHNFFGLTAVACTTSLTLGAIAPPNVPFLTLFAIASHTHPIFTPFPGPISLIAKSHAPLPAQKPLPTHHGRVSTDPTLQKFTALSRKRSIAARSPTGSVAVCGIPAAFMVLMSTSAVLGSEATYRLSSSGE